MHEELFQSLLGIFATVSTAIVIACFKWIKDKVLSIIKLIEDNTSTTITTQNLIKEHAKRLDNHDSDIAYLKKNLPPKYFNDRHN